MGQYHPEDVAERRYATLESFLERRKEGYKKKAHIFEIYKVF